VRFSVWKKKGPFLPGIINSSLPLYQNILIFKLIYLNLKMFEISTFPCQGKVNTPFEKLKLKKCVDSFQNS
jgi:hypothetical protein